MGGRATHRRQDEEGAGQGDEGETIEQLLSFCVYNMKTFVLQVRMEGMIMKVQQDFVNALQREEDPRYRFRVDRWTRKEGGGGVTCILQVSLLLQVVKYQEDGYRKKPSL